MANWIGFARTNYFHVTDIDALTKSLSGFELTPTVSVVDKSLFCILCESDDGGWPAWGEVDGEDLDFSFQEIVMPFVAEGEVLVVMECGAERLKYLTGFAAAYVRRGDSVKELTIELSDIYRMVSEKFGVKLSAVSLCAY